MKNTELEAIIEKYDLVGNENIYLTLEDNGLFDLDAIEIYKYINQHYAIKPDVMRELKKDENVRRILGGTNDLSKELYLTCDSVDGKAVVRVTDFANQTGFGVKENGKIIDSFDRWSWLDFPQYWRKSTPEEIQSMLIKKLEADGLKVGCKIDRSELPNFLALESTVIINKLNYEYNQIDDFLICDGNVVYANGKFAKIIQPELTIEQKMEILWNERNAKFI